MLNTSNGASFEQSGLLIKIRNTISFFFKYFYKNNFYLKNVTLKKILT
jgi:hypothetical protein